MKILVPYYDADNRNIDSPIISGGVEMFIKKLHAHIPEVVTFPVSIFDKSTSKQLRFKLDQEIEKHNPDLIISNYNSSSYNKYLTGKYNIPVMWINHMSTGFMSSLGTMPLLLEHQNRGHSVYHVSPYQDAKWNALSKRTQNQPFKCDGFVVPSVVEDNVLNIKISDLYDCTTVGRCEGAPDKDPFVLFRRVG
jgi:ABC-type Fe3+-hydroxamate transport system substrate-binding protein